jgi:hypothetical protein
MSERFGAPDCLVLAGVLLSAGMGLTGQGDQRQQSVDISTLRVATPEERVDARAFAKLPRFYPLTKAGTVVVQIDTPVRNPALPPLAYSSFIADAVCSSDAVIVGRLSGKRAMLTEEETSLLTYNQIAVDDWIRPTAGPATI